MVFVTELHRPMLRGRVALQGVQRGLASGEATGQWGGGGGHLLRTLLSSFFQRRSRSCHGATGLYMVDFQERGYEDDFSVAAI